MLTINKEPKPQIPFSYLVLLPSETTVETPHLSNAEVEYVRKQHANFENDFVVFHKLTHDVFVQFYKSKECSAKTAEHLRKKGAGVYKKINKCGLNTLTLYSYADEAYSVAFLEGLFLGSYSFDKYMTDEKRKQHHFREIFFEHENIDSIAKTISITTSAIFHCRNLVNEPVCYLNAEKLAEAFMALSKEVDSPEFTVKVLDKKQIQSLKMGGLLAVNQGSIDDPTFTIMEWKPKNAVNAKPLVLVGKGLVYDSGGLNLKPDNYMNNMKEDMAGAALLATTLYAVARKQLSVHIIGLFPATDNRPCGNAYASSDIITMFDGTKVEVVNTDAEGRMILADALAYAKQFSPELVIDAATLTGAASRAIGSLGLVAVHQKAQSDMDLLKSCGNEVYERIAEFPFWEEYGEMIKSEIADIKNSGEREAGMITAGKFLAHFTDYPYIHLDIAGVSFTEHPKDYFSYGGTGFGVRLLLRFIEEKYS